MKGDIMRFGTSYFGNRMLDHATKDMLSLKEAGFTYVVHTFSEFDLMFHRDNVADIVSMTQQLGLEAYVSPWGVGNVFGGEPFSHFVNFHFMDACQVLDNGQSVPMACPNAPAFRDYMNEWLDAVLAMSPDAIFWDEPHFHEQGFLSSVEGHWGCRCEYCREGFKKSFSYDMPDIENGDVAMFKTVSIASFIDGLTRKAKQAGVKNILYLNPNIDPKKPGDHWNTFLENKALDRLATGAYWKWKNAPTSLVGDFASLIKTTCDSGGLDAQMWLQNFGFINGEEKQLEEAIHLAVKAGINDIGFWSFRACEHESWLAGDDPKRDWANNLALIKRYLKSGV
jgi:hypothetical protein